LKTFSKKPLKQMRNIFYPIVLWPLITPENHKLNQIDSTLYQEALM
jgi:hypothetical protein